MATLAQKIRCEARARELFETGGVPSPDLVEYGYTCVRFYWKESRVCLVVDIDDPEALAQAAEAAAGFEFEDEAEG